MIRLYLHAGVLRKARGFTLAELVSVILIMGILAAVAIPRFSNNSTFTVRAFFDQAQSIVRYGQKIAIAQNTNIYVRLTGSSVALCYNVGCTSVVTAPSGSNSKSAATLAACSSNGSWECEAAPSGTSFVSSNASGTSYNGGSPAFYFSPQGKPYNTADSEPVSNFKSLLTVTMTGDGSNHVFYVEQETGYVHR